MRNEEHQVTVIHLHGFASSANSSKAAFLGHKLSPVQGITFHAVEFNPSPADFEYMTITGMINRLRQVVVDGRFQNIHFIASSMGALVGLHYAHRFAAVRSMLLLAPALRYGGLVDEGQRCRWQLDGSLSVDHYAFEEACPLRYDMHLDGLLYAKWVAPAAPVTIIHGRYDEVVPIEDSRAYAMAYPDQVSLIEVDSDHRLSDQLDFIWDHVKPIIYDRFGDIC